MKSSVMIKGSRYGVLLQLNPDISFADLKEEVREKFADSARFFKEAKMAVRFEGRDLSDTQEEELIEVITDAAGLNIVCILEDSEYTDAAYRCVIDKSIADLMKRDGQFYKGTLKKRQILESESSVIILGDVEYGAKVAAKGSIVVLGNAEGTLHAGITGNEDAFIAGLVMMPKSLKIAGVRRNFRYDETEENLIVCPKIAVLSSGRIALGPLTD